MGHLEHLSVEVFWKKQKFLELSFFSSKENKKKNLGLFFSHHVCVFRALKLTSTLDTPSWKFSRPRFWILTKDVISHPVWGLLCPNSIEVLGTKQPSLVLSSCMSHTTHTYLGFSLFKTTHILIRRIYDFFLAHLFVNNSKENFNSSIVLDFLVCFVD